MVDRDLSWRSLPQTSKVPKPGQMNPQPRISNWDWKRERDKEEVCVETRGRDQAPQGGGEERLWWLLGSSHPNEKQKRLVWAMGRRNQTGESRRAEMKTEALPGFLPHFPPLGSGSHQRILKFPFLLTRAPVVSVIWGQNSLNSTAVEVS